MPFSPSSIMKRLVLGLQSPRAQRNTDRGNAKPFRLELTVSTYWCSVFPISVGTRQKEGRQSLSGSKRSSESTTTAPSLCAEPAVGSSQGSCRTCSTSVSGAAHRRCCQLSSDALHGWGIKSFWPCSKASGFCSWLASIIALSLTL